VQAHVDAVVAVFEGETFKLARIGDAQRLRTCGDLVLVIRRTEEVQAIATAAEE
jgi:hypothetical protein